MSELQGTKSAGKMWNEHLHAVLYTLNVKRYASDYGVYAWYYQGDLCILNLSTDNILVAAKKSKARA